MLTMRDIDALTVKVKIRPLLDGIGYELIWNGRSIVKEHLPDLLGELIHQTSRRYELEPLKHPIEMECDPVVFCHKCDIADATHFSLCDEHRKSIGGKS